MARPSAVQIKACLLLALLAGHEAVRVETEILAAMAAQDAKDQGQDSAAVDEDKTLTPPEQQMDRENRKCVWTARGCAPDPSSDVSEMANACKWRALPLDWLPPASQSCRLTDAFMLNRDRAKYFKIASGVLSAKSKKFATKCSGSSFMYLALNRKCTRRSEHMMRTIKFMSKAQDSTLLKNLSADERREERELFDASLKNLAGAIGEEGPMVLELQAKMMANTGGFKKDPKQATEAMLAILHQLLEGSDAEKEEAKAVIRAMPNQSETLTAEEEAALDAQHVALADNLEKEANGVEALMDRVDVLAPDGDPPSDGQSLVEKSHGQNRGATFVLVAMMLTIAVIWNVALVLSIIIPWAWISVIGCAFYTLGENSDHQTGDGFVGGTTTCFKKVFTYPFVLAGRAVADTADYLFGSRGRALLDVAGNQTGPLAGR